MSANVVSIITLVVVGIGVGIAWQIYGTKPIPVMAPVGSPLTRAARQDLLQDAFNEAVFMRPGQYLTRLLVFFDNRVVDGAVNGLAALIGGISSSASAGSRPASSAATPCPCSPVPPSSSPPSCW